MGKNLENIFVLLLACIQFTNAAVSCKDMQGNTVPWFLIIKPPTAASSNYGQEFMYLDPNNLQADLQPTLINSPGAIPSTLSQVNNKLISSILFK